MWSGSASALPMSIIAATAVTAILIIPLDGTEAMMVTPGGASSALSHRFTRGNLLLNRQKMQKMEKPALFGLQTGGKMLPSNLKFKTKTLFHSSGALMVTNKKYVDLKNCKKMPYNYENCKSKKNSTKSFVDEQGNRLGNDEHFDDSDEQKCPLKMEKPLLVICGSTGTGKSDLAIAVAKALGDNAAKVISADSMQFYKGLDIAMNKVTAAEMDGVSHHMMSFLQPTHPDFYDEWDFRRDALEKIEKIWQNGRIPIVAGGSARYIEAVVFCKQRPKASRNKISLQQLFQMFPTREALYRRLQKVDPETAKEVFKNSIARIVRELQSYYSEEMMTESQRVRLEKEAQEIKGQCTQLRTRNTFVFYLDVEDKNSHELALYERVNKMIERGLLEELEDFYSKYKHEIAQWPFGAMQTIGLIAFLPYLRLNRAQKASSLGQKLLKKCKRAFQVEDTKYAEQQRKMFYSKILRPDQFTEKPFTVALNMSREFTTEIVPFAVELVKIKFLSGKKSEESAKEMHLLINEHPH